jgi:hypothetical protein
MEFQSMGSLLGACLQCVLDCQLHSWPYCWAPYRKELPGDDDSSDRILANRDSRIWRPYLAIPPAYGDSTYDQQQKDKRDRMMGSLLDWHLTFPAALKHVDVGCKFMKI